MSRPGVLFVVNSLAFGGAEKQVVTLLNHLDPATFRLHLAYLKRSEALLPQLRPGILEGIVCCDAGRGLDAGAIGRLRALIADSHIDAIVCTNSYSMLYGHLARGRRNDVRLAAVFHTTLLKRWKEKAQMLLYRRLYSRCDLLVYVCESQRRYWRDHGLRPAADEVIYNGIETDLYVERRPAEQRRAFRRSLGFEDGDYVVGLCSTLRLEKAPGDLLAAIAILRSQGIRAKALLIGDGPERQAIERAATELHLREHMVITGMKEDVRPFIGACDVMTLVSHSETFSLAALESMSLGKALVMSDVGGAREQIVHGMHGLIFEPGNVEALAMCLTRLISERLRALLGQAAARRVRERFTVQAMASRFTDSLHGLLEASARPPRQPAILRR